MKEVNHTKDRLYLLELCKYLNISKNNLCRDELGYYRLKGRRGFIDTDSEYWYVRISCSSKVRWNHIKSALKNMHLWQDGDDEGALRLGVYPSEELSNKIRKICGFTASRKLSDEDKENLRNRLNR